MVRVNGREMDIAGKTIEEYLVMSAYDRRRVAIECNDEIVPKAAYDQVVLKDGDSIEVVSFVGGG